MNKLCFENVCFLANDDFELVQGDVLVENGIIKALGKISEEQKAGSYRLNKPHWLVTPSFVNTHTHVAMTLLRGYGSDVALSSWLNDYIWPCEKKLTDQDVYWGSALGLLEMVACGITAYADMYDHMDAVAQATIESGIRANLSRGLIGFMDDDRHALAEADALYKNFNNANHSKIKVYYGPHATNTCHSEYLSEVAQHAKNAQTGIHIHISETKEEYDDIYKLHGKTPIALARDCGIFDVPTIVAHSVWLNEQDYQILKEYKVSIAHNPISNMKLASGIAPVGRLLAEKINVGLGTDGASSNNQLSILHEAQISALVNKVRNYDPSAVCAKDAFKMATICGAKSLGWDHEIGSLAIGKSADLVCFNTDKPWWTPNFDPISTLIYAARDTDIVQVYASGRLLYDEGKYLTVDQERICYEAKKIAHRLTQ